MQYIEQVLVPELTSGDIVIADVLNIVTVLDDQSAGPVRAERGRSAGSATAPVVSGQNSLPGTSRASSKAHTFSPSAARCPDRRGSADGKRVAHSRANMARWFGPPSFQGWG
jgi:hypothetical protein